MHKWWMIGVTFKCLGYFEELFFKDPVQSTKDGLRFSTTMTFQCSQYFNSVLGPPVSQVPSSCQDFVKEILFLSSLSFAPLLFSPISKFSFLFVNSFPKCSEQQSILVKKGHHLRKLHMGILNKKTLLWGRRFLAPYEL